MDENRTGRLERIVAKAGVPAEAVSPLVAGLAKELDRERTVTDAEFIKLRAEIRELELRMKLWIGGALVVAVGALATIMKILH